jgi:MoxR-like ATPase
VAESVALREPCLLEGETSVSKTSIIQFLAMLLGQPLVRLNLNGQTDTGELVGRFLPHDVTSDLPVDPRELQAQAHLLEPESQMILQRASSEGRELTQVEVQQIMANERMTAHPWRWQDGLVVEAMREGWWIVLDELNLAEPQILERLNPVLEREPMLVLTEHDNSVIGRGGTPVHPDFRIFATMNPAEYAGRSPLSPAYRDRWRGYRFVDPPTEGDYHAMLAFLVDGQQPDVLLRGRKFTGTPQAPAFGQLAEIPGIDGFLLALARFHSALESAVRNPEEHRQAHLGVRRQERYIFTRRGLLAVMDCLAGALGTATSPEEAMRVALLRYYLGRVATPSDRATVARLMDAAGIGLNTWSIGA